MPTSKQSWTVVLGLFGITSAVEGIGISQIFAFMPLYLEAMAVPRDEVPRWVGVIGSLVFLLGLPLIPLWGVWADKYSRKVVIIRSAVLEAVVLALVALSRTPWELAGSILLAGFQLGNSGVMLAALRDLAPRRRLGTAIGLFGASTSIGFAIGPAIGGFLVDGLHASVSSVYFSAAFLSLATAVMLAIGFREVRPEIVPTGRTRDLAYGAIRGLLTERSTRRLFTIFGLALLARQMALPFLPILVQRIDDPGLGAASAIALVVGTAALVGAFIAPLAGVIGDRVGFRPVLTSSLLGASLIFVVMPLAPGVTALAIMNVLAASLNGAVNAMIFGMVALEVPADRRSATLNLIFLPLYIAGIVGPAIGALIVTSGIAAVFDAAAFVFAVAAVALVYWRPRREG